MLRPYQIKLKDEIYSAWQQGFRNVLAVLPTGGGKCHSRGTKILMYDGSVKNIEDVLVGDKLMGPDSKPRNVLSLANGKETLYNVVPVKGEAWGCNESHILSLVHTETGEIIDISVKDYLEKSKHFKHLYKLFRTGVEFSNQPNRYDPYLLGLYLAEGCYCHPNITTPEPEIEEFIYSIPDVNVHVIQGRGCKTYHFSSKESGWNKNPIRKMMREITSQNDRHIPKDYLTATREIRLQVLAGLIDGDGSLGNGIYEIITKYPTLNDDILYLCRSLGLAAYSSKTIKKIKSTGFVGEYFRITISGDLSVIPNKVPRKKSSIRRQIKNVLRTGFTLENKGFGEYFGFEIDGDNRYLLGDFTVTHNTYTFATICKELAYQNNMPTCVMVHRKELVSQICMTLAALDVPHNIIAQVQTIEQIMEEQRKSFSKKFYDYRAPITVVSVDTLNSRIEKHRTWADKQRVWICDEAAHQLRGNKWGKAALHLPNAIGLGVTATPRRLDKKGLGRHADGLFDTMVTGPTTAWMIEQGYLSKYKIVIPESDYEQHLKKGSNDKADYTAEARHNASMNSHIIGDVVKNYIKYANGKQAILFADSIVAANMMKDNFIKAGIAAWVLTGDTPDKERLGKMQEFKEKKIQVLINVDLFDEGLDVPGIEVMISARKTKSVSKWLQQCGRALRPVYAKGYDLSTQQGRLDAQANGDKPFAIIIDHVGNWKENQLPETIRAWTLDRIIKKREVVNLMRVCMNNMCNQPFDRMLDACPHCGNTDKPYTRSGGERSPKEIIKMVDGDMSLLDPQTLQEMYADMMLEDPGEVQRRVELAAGPIAGAGALKKQQERIQTQKELSVVIAHWAGKMRKHGYSDRQINKLFYVNYGKTITMALSEVNAEMKATIAMLKQELDYEI